MFIINCCLLSVREYKKLELIYTDGLMTADNKLGLESMSCLITAKAPNKLFSSQQTSNTVGYINKVHTRILYELQKLMPSYYLKIMFAFLPTIC